MLERKVFRKPGGWYGVIISSPDPHYRIALLLGGGCWCWLPPLTAAAEERTGTAALSYTLQYWLGF